MVILDVREKEEFEAEHIPGSICCPMSQLDIMAPGILKNMNATDVIVMCRTGNRAKLAMTEFNKLDLSHRFICFEGGIIKWKQDGKEVQGKGGVFPLMRQVQIFASSMIFVAFLLSHYLHPNAVYLALFVGFGLAMAGWTGLCPAASILQKMPWNKKDAVSCTTNKSCCD